MVYDYVISRHFFHDTSCVTTSIVMNEVIIVASVPLKLWFYVFSLAL